MECPCLMLLAFSSSMGLNGWTCSQKKTSCSSGSETSKKESSKPSWRTTSRPSQWTMLTCSESEMSWNRQSSTWTRKAILPSTFLLMLTVWIQTSSIRPELFSGTAWRREKDVTSFGEWPTRENWWALIWWKWTVRSTHRERRDKSTEKKSITTMWLRQSVSESTWLSQHLQSIWRFDDIEILRNQTIDTKIKW